MRELKEVVGGTESDVFVNCFFGVNVIFNKELISSSYLKIWFLFVFLMIFMKNNNKKYNKFKISVNDCLRDFIFLEICYVNDFLFDREIIE